MGTSNAQLRLRTADKRKHYSATGADTKPRACAAPLPALSRVEMNAKGGALDSKGTGPVLSLFA